MKKKYAMVLINSRQDCETGEILLRRVLISYKLYINNTFYGTKLITKDHIFEDEESFKRGEKPYLYVFKDDRYYYITHSDDDPTCLVTQKKRYHYNPEYAQYVNVPPERLKPILFKTDSERDAIGRFKFRGERS